jgi:hypothetical protein
MDRMRAGMADLINGIKTHPVAFTLVGAMISVILGVATGGIGGALFAAGWFGGAALAGKLSRKLTLENLKTYFSEGFQQIFKDVKAVWAATFGAAEGVLKKTLALGKFLVVEPLKFVFRSIGGLISDFSIYVSKHTIARVLVSVLALALVAAVFCTPLGMLGLPVVLLAAVLIISWNVGVSIGSFKRAKESSEETAGDVGKPDPVGEKDEPSEVEPKEVPTETAIGEGGVVAEKGAAAAEDAPSADGAGTADAPEKEEVAADGKEKTGEADDPSSANAKPDKLDKASAAKGTEEEAVTDQQEEVTKTSKFAAFMKAHPVLSGVLYVTGTLLLIAALGCMGAGWFIWVAPILAVVLAPVIFREKYRSIWATRGFLAALKAYKNDAATVIGKALHVLAEKVRMHKIAFAVIGTVLTVAVGVVTGGVGALVIGLIWFGGGLGLIAFIPPKEEEEAAVEEEKKEVEGSERTDEILEDQSAVVEGTTGPATTTDVAVGDAEAGKGGDEIGPAEEPGSKPTSEEKSEGLSTETASKVSGETPPVETEDKDTISEMGFLQKAKTLAIDFIEYLRDHTIARIVVSLLLVVITAATVGAVSFALGPVIVTIAAVWVLVGIALILFNLGVWMGQAEERVAAKKKAEDEEAEEVEKQRQLEAIRAKAESDIETTAEDHGEGGSPEGSSLQQTD